MTHLVTLCFPLRLPRHLAAGCITGYQRHISPRKGFRCAHRALHGGESCSQFAKRAILEKGILAALPLTRQRFRECGAAARTLKMGQGPFEESTHQPPARTAPKTKAHKTPRQRRTWEPDACCYHGSDCGCHALSNTSCDALSHGLAKLPHCSGVDFSHCTALDCGALDCGVLDCSGCCSWP